MTALSLQQGEADELRALLEGMQTAYLRGDNAMEYARVRLGHRENLTTATMIAYDLQGGSYVESATVNTVSNQSWVAQTTRLIAPYVPSGGTILEVGVGEATTLAGVLSCLSDRSVSGFGLDISWSRCAYGRTWLVRQQQQAKLFVADLFHIPLADNSIDVVYTSHSLEPNGGHEAEALRELYRVARRAVVMLEPVYELANADAQARMRQHGYVRGLKATAEALGYSIQDYRLLDFCINPLNPSGVICIRKGEFTSQIKPEWRCPLTHVPLEDLGGAMMAPSTGLVYPILGGIPLLCTNHAVLASAYGRVMIV